MSSMRVVGRSSAARRALARDLLCVPSGLPDGGPQMWPMWRESQSRTWVESTDMSGGGDG